MNKLRFFLFLTGALGLTMSCFSQTTSDATGKQARFIVEKTARAETGELVVCVRIFAEGGPLTLQGKPSPGKSAQDADSAPPPFSLSHAYLLETATGQKIPALAKLPRQPFFGPLDLIAVIEKGDWIEMGVAFPFTPAPPSTGAGGPAKSQWLLYLPLDAKPVPVTLPAQP